jgi:two-component system CheB/CheR fusion protein
MRKDEPHRIKVPGTAVANARPEQELKVAQRQADARVGESEDRFRKMADEAPVIMWMHGLKKDLVYINKAGLSYGGLSEKDYLGQKWLDHIHPDDLQGWQAYDTAFNLRRKFVVEYRQLNLEGQYRWLLSSGWPRFLPDGTFAGYIGVLLDIHERKQAEEEKRQLADRFFRAQVKERSRIGRELHDDFAQRLALLTIRLQEMQLEPTLSSKNRLQIAELRKQANEISVDLTLFSHRLHSSFLEKWGLATAVKNQCKDISRLHQVQVACQIGDLPSIINENTAVTLFRVLQEALHNTIKHSQATKLVVELSADDGNLVLSVVDNGIGFDVAAAQQAPTGLGLISMKERLELVGGTMSIDSNPSGTRLSVRVPIGQARHYSQKTGTLGARHTRAA